MSKSATLLQEAIEKLTAELKKANADREKQHPKRDNMEWNYITNRYEWNGEPPDSGMW